MEKTNDWLSDNTLNEDDFCGKDAAKCEACGVLYHNHLGLIGTCSRLMEAMVKIDSIYGLVDAIHTKSYQRMSHVNRLVEAERILNKIFSEKEKQRG